MTNNMEQLKKKNEFLLSHANEIDSDPLGDSIFPPSAPLPPQERVVTIDQAMRSYRIAKDVIEMQSAERVSTIGEDIKAGVKRTGYMFADLPEMTRNLLVNTFDGHVFPNATQEEAFAIVDASANRLRASREALNYVETSRGTADTFTSNIAGGATQILAYGLVGLATGGYGVGVLAGTQEAANLSQDFIEDYQNKNEGRTEGMSRAKDSLYAIAHGALAGYIENALGVERLFRGAVPSNIAQRFAKHVAVGAGGEGLEEYLQEGSSYLFGTLAGHEDRTFAEFQKDALTNAMYGAILGGGFGAGLYFPNRSRMIKGYIQSGFTEQEAVQITDTILDTGKTEIVQEMALRSQLTEAFGDGYNELVDKIQGVVEFAGFKEKMPEQDSRRYAETVALDLGAQAIRNANLMKVPVREVLDISNIITHDNIIYLETPNMHDPKAMNDVKNAKKQEIKDLRKQIGMDNRGRINELNNQIKILDTRLRAVGFQETIGRLKNARTKAGIDQAVIANTNPEILSNLQGIRQANQTERFVYVGNTKLPVNYTVKPMSEVQASHIKGEINPKYTLKELQNRTRGTVTDDAILQGRAANFKPEEMLESPNTQYGAPIINANGEIIAGNGRFETLRRAYELGNGEGYIESLNKLGFDTNGIENPVLVRQTSEDLTPQQQVGIAEASNVSQTSAFDHARLAFNDAKLLGKEVNDAISFAAQLPVTERQAYIRENGTYDMLALQRRFDDAVMAWVIGDTKTFEAAVLSGRLTNKVIQGITRKGGEIIEFANQYPQVGLQKDLRTAVIKSTTFNRKSQYIDAIQQTDIVEGNTFTSDAILYAMTFSDGSTQIGDFLNRYMAKNASNIEGRKDSFLADTFPTLTKEDITGQTIKENSITEGLFNEDGGTQDPNLRALFTNQIPQESQSAGTTLFQGGNGMFDTELKAIVIGSNFNAGTLPHEIAHFWLDKNFNMWRTAKASPEFMADFGQLASILGISPEQVSLTRDQQERFATYTEGYIFDRASIPDGAKPIMQLYLDWVPAQYNNVLDIGFRDSEGRIQNPIFDQKTKDYFDQMYSVVASVGKAPTTDIFNNQTNRKGQKMKSTQAEAKNRESIINKEASEKMEKALADQTPEVIEAAIRQQEQPEPMIENALTEAAEDYKPSFVQRVMPGRGTNTREQMIKDADAYIKSNKVNALEVAFASPIPDGAQMEMKGNRAYKDNDTGINRAVLIMRVQELYDRGSAEWAELYHNLALERSYAGKSPGLTNQINQQFYLGGVVAMTRGMEQRAAMVKYGKGKDSINLWNRDIDRFISQNTARILETAPDTQARDVAINQMLHAAKQQFGMEDSQIQLLQEDLKRMRSAKKTEKRIFEDLARAEIKKIAKGAPTTKDISTLMELSIAAQKASKDIDSNNTAEAVAASIAIRNWQDYIAEKGVPQSLMQKVIGQYAPRAMLSAPSTHIVNIASNSVEAIIVKAAMRFHYGENLVENSALKAEKDRLWAVFNATAGSMNLAQALRADDVARIHGEQHTLSTQKGLMQKLDPMRWLGDADFFFRVQIYLDTLGRIATKNAKGDAALATKLFNEYKQLNSTDQVAIDARTDAILVGNLAVFQQDGTLAKIMTSVRNNLDLINLESFGQYGHKGLGTLLVPFAKTPANIVGMGIEALVSPFKYLAFKAGLKKSWTLADSIAVANMAPTLAMVAAIIAASGEYEPPYKGGAYDSTHPYDSIKVGGVWIKLDAFGAMANPLRFCLTIMNSGRKGETVKGIGKATSGLLEDLPLYGELGNVERIDKDLGSWAARAAYGQANKLFPAILRTPAKMLGRASGYEIKNRKGVAGTFARAYGLDGSETSINDYIRFLFNRVTIDEKKN